MMIAELYNPNLAWDEYSHKIAFAEVEVVAMIAALLGYEPKQAAGVFTFGGTGTTLYGIKVGIEKALPNSLTNGVRQDAVIFASDRPQHRPPRSTSCPTSNHPNTDRN